MKTIPIQLIKFFEETDLSSKIKNDNFLHSFKLKNYSLAHSLNRKLEDYSDKLNNNLPILSYYYVFDPILERKVTLQIEVNTTKPVFISLTYKFLIRKKKKKRLLLKNFLQTPPLGWMAIDASEKGVEYFGDLSNKTPFQNMIQLDK